MSPLYIGIIGIILFLFLVFFKVPIALSMSLVGFWGYGYIVSFGAASRLLASEIFSSFSSYSLSVIPMFVLMGFLAYYAGIGNKLFSFAYKIIGRLPGGLAMASQVACTIFGAICGSATATAATIGSVAIPEMKKYDYDSSLSAGCIAAGGAIGVMIPPSIIFILYGVATEQSIAKLFLAGVLPGVLLMFLYIIAIWVICTKNPNLGPTATGPRLSLSEKLMPLKGVLLQVFAVFCLSLGGLFAGWFTPTEAGGVGAAGVLLVTIIDGSMSWKKFVSALRDTTSMVAMIMFLVAGATIFGRFMTISRIPEAIAQWISALPLPPFFVMVIVLLIYVALGMFIEAIPLILLSVPIFFPLVVNVLGYDPIWFGVIIVMVGALGIITPPVGINVYVVSTIAREIPIDKIFRGIIPFLIAAIICCILLILFPWIATFLPYYVIG